MADAKKRSRAKRKARPPAAAPVHPAGMPKQYRARVRMYRQGLGDCFLVTFPRGKKPPFQMLIDCGALGRDAAFMQTIVGHLRDTLTQEGDGRKARLDVVVATHEHRDHLSGFNQARDIFSNDIDFGSVWLGWTENLSKPEIAKIKAARRKAVAKVKGALASPVMKAAGIDTVKDYASLLAFSTDDDDTGSGSIAEALEYLKKRGKTAGDLRYLEPGDGPMPLEGVDGVRVYVLGPPRDPLLLKTSGVTEGMKQEGVIYHLSHAGSWATDALTAAATASAAAVTADVDRFYPFSAEHRIPADANNRYYAALAPFVDKTYGDPKQAWRRIDTDWLTGFGQLALALDNDTNNTSLVLAFEFVKTREVLLFVGDAQVGNWQSWGAVSFSIPERADKVPAHDLLGRAIFYKVGHHCSHNATLKKGGLELMTRDDLVAFIPLDKTTASQQGAKGWDMPAAPLYKALRDRAGNRVVISDVADAVCKEATDAGVCATGMYIDYYVR